jgi:CBS domain-containing protein
MPGHIIGDMIERDHLVRGNVATSIRAAAREMTEHCCGSILVMDGDRLVGIFTERDLLNRVAAEGEDLERTTLGEVMACDPDTIGADEPAKAAIRKMDEFSYRYLPVMDGGKVIGVISTRHLPFADVLGMEWELEERHRLAERMW